MALSVGGRNVEDEIHEKQLTVKGLIDITYGYCGNEDYMEISDGSKTCR